ncbi:pyridoxal phosphate-dependent decarboxylase family protein [Cellulomonas bogoriensis]|uniref:Pyridoxal-dependent decarboxylase n=1 Tax=Cellulomonas bogoriensis 69B4 = DSM 16987 TaxID=1386082 RepID=A0A0A0BZJ6_9CELL|nr:aminotransferase class V-fold PLP-dependent enzyme [Cellulomonas bogoriensis]KGM12599.1 pyridoxal-dependent decarboxylase [Cellulomonas bogoriensis 69B4 = DSM 16987]
MSTAPVHIGGPPHPVAATGEPALLDATGVEHLAANLDQARDLLTAAFAGPRTPFSGITPAESAALVGAVDLDDALGDTVAALDEVRRLYVDHAVWFDHPHYQAHLNCPVALPAVVADLLATAVNSSLDTWDQSGPATHMERHLLTWTAGRMGFGPAADGIFTSGGTQSNLHALLVARGEALARGAAQHDLRVLTTGHTHFSARTSAKVLGLAPDAVVTVATEPGGRMDPTELDRTLTDLHRQGRTVMAVVATAGTTDLGVVDPLTAIAGTCRRHQVWFHVDAAYGGGLLVSRRRRALLDGIERADSVTVDFHKTFFQPVASSAVLVADRATLRHVTHHAHYLNPHDEHAVPNQVDKSMQTTRRFDALKLWMTLRVLGPDRIGDMLDTVIDLAAQVRDDLAVDPDFAVVTGTDLSTVLFRFEESGVDAAVLDRVNREARDRLFATGMAAVARTVLDGRTWLKLTLLNPATTLQDVRRVLDLVRGHARHALADRTGPGPGGTTTGRTS